MKYQLFKELMLAADLPDKGLRAGDVVTPVEHHSIIDGEDGYTLEVFNALGETIAVITVAENALAPLSDKAVLSARPFN